MFPDFEEVLREFSLMLERHGAPKTIVWVAPQHAIYCGRSWKVYEGVGINECEVSSMYREARKGRFGVRMGLLCAGDGKAFCYFYAPFTLEDAEHKLLVGHSVKLSIPTIVPSACVVKKWSLSAMCGRVKQSFYRRWKNSAFGIS